MDHWKELRLLSMLFIVATAIHYSHSFTLDNNLMNALDFTRGTLLSFKSKQQQVTEEFTTITGAGKKIILPTSGNRRRTSRVRPRPAPPRKIVVTKKFKPNLNKYLLAINQIEKAILEAGAMAHTSFTRNTVGKLKKLKHTILIACQSKQYVLARQLVGHAIYLTSIVTTRGRRQTGGGSSILNDIQTLIGNDQFTKLLALDGGVTLSFAIDTTGSMKEEIEASIAIATDIVNQPRTYLCDYVLSPFNDPITAPGHGPVVYRPPEEKEIFINNNLKTLRPWGGGDCDELAITGIQEIYTTSLMEFSPIYVFTDAGPKDATPDNLDTLLTSALAMSTPINFFLSRDKRSCISDASIEKFRELALSTGGELLVFGSGFQLKSMGEFINTALSGGSVIPAEGNTGTNTITIGRRKRAASTRSEYTVYVDDTVEKLTVSVSTQRDTSDVRLIDPRGRTIRGGKSLKRGAVFVVTKPATGQWKISVSGNGGKHSITCKGISHENIDFGYEFLVGIPTRGTVKPIVSATPITGKQATVIVAVSGYEKVIAGSLKLSILSQTKVPIGTKYALQPYGSSPGRFTAKYNVPQTIYYLAIEGKTKNGFSFKRMSPKPVKPQKIVIQTIMARNGYSITRGDTRGTTIILGVRNLGATERFTVTVSDSKGYLASPVRKSLYIINGRMSLLPLRFKAPPTAKKGSTYMVQVIVRGNSSKAKQSKALMMLVV